MNHDNMRHYRYAREHDRYNAAAWPDPVWKSLLRVAGAMLGAVCLVAAAWVLTVGIFLI